MTNLSDEDWGLLPDSVRAHLRRLEWDNARHRRERLLNVRAFPIRIGLKPPTGRKALDAMAHFQAYIAAWQNWRGPGNVEYQTRDLPLVGCHALPTTLELERFEDLAAMLGADAIAWHRHWQLACEPLRAFDQALYPELVRNLGAVECLDVDAAHRLAAALSQLAPGLGRDRYLRALPLTGVDTKFVEQHESLLAALADVLHKGAVREAGGLTAWLACRPLPRDWLWVRPLCAGCRQRLGGLDVLQVSTSTLLETPLPGRKVLIAENVAPGYALPMLADTVAVFGGGANVQWTRAAWLADRQIGYWGDIDTWGFDYLAEVRRNQPHTQALLMDRTTFLQHVSRAVDLKEPNSALPDGLTEPETTLYQDLLERRHGITCLEQERISADWLLAALDRWRKGER